MVIVVKRHPDGTRSLHQIGVLEGQPVRAKVVWDADTGPAEGYEELLS